MSMPVHVINLDRSSERLRNFHAANSHLAGLERFPAVDGASQSVERLVADGVMDRNLRYSPGAVGAALSHLRLWEMCSEKNVPITVCEDDAVVHHAFEPTAARLLGALGADWDIVLWTWSLQSAVHYELLRSGGSCITQCDYREMLQGLAKFQDTLQTWDLYRLRRAFGAICYSVSPGGARKLRQAALPLRPLNVWVPLSDEPVPNIGIDVVMCAEYERLNAYVCVPPLAVTPQTQQSTIR